MIKVLIHKKLIRRSIKLFTIGAILVPTAVLGQSSTSKKPDNSLQRYVDTWVKDPLLTYAGVSIFVYDLNANQRIAYENPNLALVPASTMKLVTTATALEMLGGAYRFRTRIQYTGEIDSNGVLHGNVYIKGGGDPSLGSGYYPNLNGNFKEQWVKAIQEQGIKEIDGQVIGDATVFGINTIPTYWGWGDIGNYYGAAANGLTIYDNLTKLVFRSGPKAGDSTWIDCTEPFVPEMRIYNRVRAANSSADNAYIYGGNYDPFRIAEGSIPKGKDEFRVRASIHDPAYVATVELEHALAQEGIRAKYRCTTVRRQIQNEVELDTLPRKDIHTMSGASIGNLVYWINQKSVNLFAEHLLKGIGVRRYGDGSVYSSAKAIHGFWEGRNVSLPGLEITDGSGLSRANAVSARHLIRILKYMKGSKSANTFLSSLSVAGKSGTLAGLGRGTAAANNLKGKSGSMTRVRSYAGYVRSRSGRELAFAIIVNNYQGTSSQIRSRMEKLMVQMANFNS